MIIYEDNHLLIVNKPPGILVQADQTSDRTILDDAKAYVKKTYKKPGEVYLHPAHRLDRPVSGCLILCRTSKALSRMTTMWRDRQVDKLYYALSDHRADSSSGELTHYLHKDTKTNVVKIKSPKTQGAKASTLRYALVGELAGRCLYGIRPITGRSHQIRVQMSALKCPLIGDVKYKGAERDDKTLIYLHCYALRFVHPVKKEEMVVSCLPQKGQYWKMFESLMVPDFDLMIDY